MNFLPYVFECIDEIKPKRDLDFTGVIDQLRKWRPPCLIDTRADSDIDTDEEDCHGVDTVLHDDMFDIPPPHLGQC